MPDSSALYQQLSSDHIAALGRLARAYEADPEKRRDLLQDIHFGLWRSFEHFDGRCSLRTWIYRVAHNIAATHVSRQLRGKSIRLVSLDEAESIPHPSASYTTVDRQQSLERLFMLVQQLEPIDRQVIVCYLEELDAAAIAEITGLSAPNVATKVHRIKNILARRFHEGGQHGD